MANLIKYAQGELKEILLAALGRAVAAGELPAEPMPAFTIEIPADTTHGDFATNAAMVSARAFKLPPKKIAEIICNNCVLEGTSFERFEIAGPGFINFFLSSAWFAKTLLAVFEEKENYGRTNYGQGKKAMVEFVSANPTGPMHMGNARGGALGDCLASALAFAGYEVTREFYVNDAGNQIEKFANSLSARYLQLYKKDVEFPEDGYQGDDIKERAQEFADIHGESYVNESDEVRKKALVEYALPKNVEKLKADLAKYRINYDVWFFESTLHQSGAVKKVVDILTKNGYTYEKEGALWYKATAFGAEKDDVLIRANGIPTYFAADIAYHYNKFIDRGFDKVINIWGADHHGHVGRLKGAMTAVGIDSDKLDVVLMQLVRLVRGGEVVRMSKRTGKAITLNDLLDDVPVDAARFFFNLREPNSHFDFDLDLAVEESAQNPVYYVQYAHARICSIFKNLGAEGITPRACTPEELKLLSTREEMEVARYIARLPDEVTEAAKNYDPARLTRYCVELATMFHKFYNAHRVKGEDEPLMQARMALCAAVKIVLGNVLGLLKITAPEAM
ncbi:arginine--tRNA ligase [Acetanaerobacterium elongatum]|uniref:Arginine--tRNA ligase n=1 Tax=Acetanaerobacterium elongatum TaxID=258515 RepID=A0A1H0GBA6_9FIRM|nr:arginine--tRNA ligase [Acetanaerobacterium elongatum]SDO04177.1 arginyl-tRNA synthetase [Acetanaerobacterium elongatum]